MKSDTKNTPAGGVKYDTTKPRLELVPPELIESVAEILTFGASKYGARNWEQGITWGRLYGALQRHLNAFWKGEKSDPDTGRSHLWHAGCCIAFLIWHEIHRPDLDDRPKGPGK